MFKQIRLRLALWYTTVTAILLCLLSLCIWGYVRFTLIDRVDDTISHIAEVLSRSIVNDPINREMLFRAVPSLEADHIDLEWFDDEAVLQWTTLTVPLEVPLTLSANFRTVHPSDAEPLRQFTQPIWAHEQLIGYLRVSHPWFEVTKPEQQLMLDLSLGVGFTLVVIGVCGWWLSGIALKPAQESYQHLKQFTADVSHELRNPLAVIQTNTQVALLQSNPRSYLEVIERLTLRMGKLLEDLLFLARHDRSVLPEPAEPCNLPQILGEVLEEQQLEAMQKSIELRVQGLDRTLFIPGYPDQLVRLFTNLVSNALRYTPSLGTIEISLTTHAHQVQVAIKDTGPGIPDAAVSHIFERYYRLGEGNGTGLGLAIAQVIVDRHGGKIGVESQPAHGTTFRVTLPL